MHAATGARPSSPTVVSDESDEEKDEQSIIHDRQEWHKYTLRDLRDWGRDYDGVADVSNDESVTKSDLIETFLALDVPLPGSDGQPTMDEHVREFRARHGPDHDLEDRQTRAKEVLERTQKRQAAHAAELLNELEPKRYRTAAPAAPAAAAAASSSYYPPMHSLPPPSFYATPPQQQQQQQQQPYDVPPPGLSPQALAEFFEYRARMRGMAFPSLSYGPAPSSSAAAAAAAASPASYSDAAANDSTLCIVCASNKRSVVFQGCGHFVCCRDCVEEIRRNRGECPMCRTKFGYKTMITGVKL